MLHAPYCWQLPESVCVGSCVFVALYGPSLWPSAALPGGSLTGKDAILGHNSVGTRMQIALLVISLAQHSGVLKHG